MTPFERLGLAEDADEPAIKRAYARALRGARPDEDALAFQALREAYEAALWSQRQAEHRRWLEQTAQDQEAAGDVSSTTDAAHDPGHETPPSRAGLAADASSAENDGGVQWSFDEIGNAVIGEALRRPLDDYQAWLREFPPLYSLYVKSAIGPQLPHALLHAPRLGPGTLQAIVEFFDLDSLGGLDAQGQWALHHLRLRDRVDFDAFLAELLQNCAARGNTQQFSQWLSHLPEAHDPALREYVGAMLYEALLDRPDLAPIPPERMQIVCRVFGFADRNELQARNNVRWTLAYDDARAFGQPKPGVVRELKRSFWALRTLLFAAFAPWHINAVGRLASALRQAYGELPPGLDPDQWQVHAELAYPGYWGQRRWAVLVLRTLVALALLLPMGDPGAAIEIAAGLLIAQILIQAWEALRCSGAPPPRNDRQTAPPGKYRRTAPQSRSL